MILQNNEQLNIYKQAGLLSIQILWQVSRLVKEGSSPMKIDDLAFELCKKNDVRPSFYGVESGNLIYNHSCCISVNEQILHAIPIKKPFEYGDLVKIDFGIAYQGFFTDHCFTFVAGGYKNQKDRLLVEVSHKATLASLPLAIAGRKTGDLGFAMRRTAKESGFEVVKDFVGHGIGNSLHDRPIISPYALQDTGDTLKKGMVLCLECQVTAGSGDYIVKPDGWTIVSADGEKAGMVEYMVVVEEDSPLILTPTQDWNPVVV